MVLHRCFFSWPSTRLSSRVRSWAIGFPLNGAALAVLIYHQLTDTVTTMVLAYAMVIISGIILIFISFQTVVSLFYGDLFVPVQVSGNGDDDDNGTEARLYHRSPEGLAQAEAIRALRAADADHKHRSGRGRRGKSSSAAERWLRHGSGFGSGSDFGDDTLAGGPGSGSASASGSRRKRRTKKVRRK